MNLEDLRESLNCGILRIYGGLKPAHEAIAVTNQPLLAELILGEFLPMTNGLVTLNIMGKCELNGTASWFRLFEHDWETPVVDGTVGNGSQYELNLDGISNNHFLAGSLINIRRFAIHFS